MVKILVSDQVEIDRLDLGVGFEVDYRPGVAREDLLKIAADYEALIVRSRTKVDRELIDRAVKLKLVARPGTGLDNVDVDYAKTRGIQVVNSPESLVEAVSEHVILLMLALGRHLVEADSSTKAGRWEKNSLVGRELKGKVLGIVGLGRIGRRIAEVAKALGMSVLGYDVVQIPPEVVAGLGIRLVGLDELFSSSDFVTLHVPMTPETMHLAGAARLASMKSSACLINTSRGGVVDEAALAKALTDGRLGGAALDVFEKEPPTGTILGAPNVVLTPHIGGQTEEAQSDAITVVAGKVRAFFNAR